MKINRQLRILFALTVSGFSRSTLIQGAVSTNATRSTATDIEAYLYRFDATCRIFQKVMRNERFMTQRLQPTR